MKERSVRRKVGGAVKTDEKDFETVYKSVKTPKY